MDELRVEKTIAAYDKNARGYYRKFRDYEVYRQRIEAFQKKYIPHGAKVLDLGCGPGQNIALLQGLDPACTFTGVDLSNELLAIAKTKTPRARFYNQDLRSLDIEGSFEVVIASFCIVHLVDSEVEELIHQIAKLLQKGGTLYLSYMNGESSGFEQTSFSEQEIFFNYYADSFILARLEAAGFAVLEIGKEDYRESDGSVTTDTFIYAGLAK